METTVAEPALAFLPQMITPREAAAFLRVDSRTVLTWIKEDRIPYLKLPGGEERSQYRIPLGALVSSLSGTFDLAGALREIEAEAAETEIVGEEVKQVAIEGAAVRD